MSLDELFRILRQEPVYTLRIEAVRLVLLRLEEGSLEGPDRLAQFLCAACDDPHFRVRQALCDGLRRHGERGLLLAQRLVGLLADSEDARVRGLVQYIKVHLLGESVPAAKGHVPADLGKRGTVPPDLWEEDPAVLRSYLRKLSDEEIQACRAQFPRLLSHEDAGVRRLAGDLLRRYGETPELVLMLERLKEPREPGLVEEAGRILAFLNLDRKTELLRAYGRPLPFFGQEAEHNPGAEAEPDTVCAVTAQPPEARLRPTGRTKGPQVLPSFREFGRTGISVSPLGISGHYGLPAAGFAHAVSSGVNLFFWEPAYTEQTRFFAQLRKSERQQLWVVCGTFEAEPALIRRDLDRALRSLRVERLLCFLLFWVRSKARVTREALDVLDQAQKKGELVCHGISTHLRPLALDALARRTDALMVRHSAAHRGVEQDVLPEAARQGTGLLTFSNLCYGRILRPRGWKQPTPADCYRYSLSQKGVTACLSAPRDLAQLEDNLAVLANPEITKDRLPELLAHGQAVYRENRDFLELIRRR